MRFYTDLFEFETELHADSIGVCRVSGGQALILFPNRTDDVTEPMSPPSAADGVIPKHGGSGRLLHAIVLGFESVTAADVADIALHRDVASSCDVRHRVRRSKIRIRNKSNMKSRSRIAAPESPANFSMVSVI
jgi:hypothetical protein